METEIRDEGPKADLSIDLEEICYLISRLREFEEEVPDDEDSGDALHLDDEAELADEAEETPPKPEDDELHNALGGLNDDQLYDLVSLMWLGRGDYTDADWDDARKEAGELRPRQIPGYLLGTPLAADYLEEGLSMIGLSCADLEAGRR